jgi:hypothetical protein
MELIFNELSFKPHVNNEVLFKNRFIGMLNKYGQLKETFGITNLLFPRATFNLNVSEKSTFIQWASSLTDTSEKNKVLALIRTPFCEDILEDAEQDKTNKYYYENAEIPVEQEYCTGLGICHAKERIAISLNSHNCWKPHIISFKEIIDDNFNAKDVEVYNVCESGEKLNADLSQKLLYYGTLELMETDIEPENKKIKLSSNHHGNSKLEAFAKKIFRSKYVLEVINNIDFSPKAVNLIKEKYSDGTIDIVLYWEDAGYGMRIKTTGRNYRETEAIAEILKNEFDR